jgi:hypothetical protein
LGESWENAWPVAFDLAPFRGAELNYLVHKKELLAILRGMKKWCTDLRGSHVFIYTDHCTLLNFDLQKDLSRHQEFMSQFDLTITYICSEDNCVADVLSRLPHEIKDVKPIPNHKAWQGTHSVNAVLTHSADMELLNEIKKGYKTEKFCIKLQSCKKSFDSVKKINDLWYIGKRLVILQTRSIHKDLFRPVHNTLGHFRA